MDDTATLTGDFAQFDTDGNGHIDRIEFGALVDFLGLGLEESQANEAFRAIDSNGNGRIEFLEFKEWWLSYQQS